MAESTKNNMNGQRIYRMAFGGVYPLYVQKAEKKGRTKEEVDEIIFWLTGYNKQALQQQIDNKSDFETFFDQAPQMNPDASKITGVICGCRVEEIEDKLVQKVRYLDKLIDELAKGKTMEDEFQPIRHAMEQIILASIDQPTIVTGDLNYEAIESLLPNVFAVGYTRTPVGVATEPSRGWQLDHILLSPDWQVRHSAVIPGRADHYFCYADIVLETSYEK